MSDPLKVDGLLARDPWNRLGSHHLLLLDIVDIHVLGQGPLWVDNEFSQLFNFTIYLVHWHNNVLARMVIGDVSCGGYRSPLVLISALFNHVFPTILVLDCLIILLHYLLHVFHDKKWSILLLIFFFLFFFILYISDFHVLWRWHLKLVVIKVLAILSNHNHEILLVVFSDYCWLW
jgi:hypothetical protein